MHQPDNRIAIVGAGHAGGTAAALLRQHGWTGPITLIGDEPVLPYQRPPLSKAWLKGKADAGALALKHDAFYAERAIALKLGATVAGADAAARSLSLSTGETVAFDTLILATGARARGLGVPGHDLPGVLALRSAADAERLKTALATSGRLAVIGGGYLGLEVAASARSLGVDVVVIERAPRILARVASEPLSAFFQDYHQRRDVVFECDAEVAAFHGEDGVLRGVALADGRTIAADLALVSIGAAPNDALARALGCACDDGIIVDSRARTSVPGIYAIGDATRRPLPLYEATACVESVPSALEQARQLVADLTGAPAPAPEAPWFWSDQYDVKLQIVGLPIGVAQTYLRGDRDSGRFAIFHLDAEERVQAVEAVNAPAEFMFGRMLVADRRRVSPDRLADATIPIKQCLAQATQTTE
ncbi:NAD(P)/FAD-dependent oxidoreductase [Sphingomonas flavalba]|uniref:NAD(P)/FAD-dependent oxidoreductase n=1 Tax=Sphingomonas flavalba TaxID=2559804 RepID=UPI0039E0F7B3